jgi:hypothetical protein
MYSPRKGSFTGHARYVQLGPLPIESNFRMLQGNLSTVSRPHSSNHHLTTARNNLLPGSLDAHSPCVSIRLISQLDHARERHRASLSSRASTYDSIAIDSLEDELDICFHKGLNPEVNYCCPTSAVLWSLQPV